MGRLQLQPFFLNTLLLLYHSFLDWRPFFFQLILAPRTLLLSMAFYLADPIPHTISGLLFFARLSTLLIRILFFSLPHFLSKALIFSFMVEG